uniref:Uncharacterized protein n=1 Tax=Lotharella globosa TaxID=91324 RepID=A0A6V3KF98_9EUKA
MVRVYVIASFTTTKRQQKQRHSNTPCGGAQIEKQVGKTEENKSNTEANKETKQVCATTSNTNKQKQRSHTNAHTRTNTETERRRNGRQTDRQQTDRQRDRQRDSQADRETKTERPLRKRTRHLQIVHKLTVHILRKCSNNPCQKKDKEEPGPRFSEDTVFIDVRGYEEAERDGYQLGTLIRPPDNACVLVERCPTPSRHNATTVMTSRSYNTFWFEPHTLLLRQYWQLWYTLVCVRCL